MRKIALLAATAAALAIAGAAQAANTVTLNETLDISLPQQGGAFGGWRGFTDTGGAFSPSYSFALAAGDSVDMNVDFVGEQTLTLTNIGTLWLFNYETDGIAQDVNATGTLQLLDAHGAVLYTSNVVTDSEGAAHFGQFFGPGDFAGLPGTVTFGGLRYQGVLNGYEANNPDETPGLITRNYGDPDFSFTADGAVINGAGGVPEPASWALMIAGFGMAGATLRRRRALTV